MLQRALCQIWQHQITNSFRHAMRSQQNVTKIYQIRTYRVNQPRNSNIKPTSMEGHIKNSVPKGNIIKAVVFTGAFSAGSFLGAAIMEYENNRSMMIAKARKTYFQWWLKPQHDKGFITQCKSQIQRAWSRLSQGEKVFLPICALNLIVFALWRLPSLGPTMIRYFTSTPATRIVCWPMFLATFSHYSAFHMFANMYVLHSFCDAAVHSLGKEHFYAVYLTAGVLSSLSSFLYKTITTQRGVSLGASGAIMTILAFVCTQYPETELSVLFLPVLTFSAESAIKIVMGIDFAGCMLGWKFFDHAAHLGGALYGIFWAYYGPKIWAKRIIFLNYYHDLRKSK